MSASDWFSLSCAWLSSFQFSASSQLWLSSQDFQPAALMANEKMGSFNYDFKYFPYLFLIWNITRAISWQKLLSWRFWFWLLWGVGRSRWLCSGRLSEITSGIYAEPEYGVTDEIWGRKWKQSSITFHRLKFSAQPQSSSKQLAQSFLRHYETAWVVGKTVRMTGGGSQHQKACGHVQKLDHTTVDPTHTIRGEGIVEK